MLFVWFNQSNHISSLFASLSSLFLFIFTFFIIDYFQSSGIYILGGFLFASLSFSGLKSQELQNYSNEQLIDLKSVYTGYLLSFWSPASPSSIKGSAVLQQFQSPPLLDFLAKLSILSKQPSLIHLLYIFQWMESYLATSLKLGSHASKSQSLYFKFKFILRKSSIQRICFLFVYVSLRQSILYFQNQEDFPELPSIIYQTTIIQIYNSIIIVTCLNLLGENKFIKCQLNNIMSEILSAELETLFIRITYKKSSSTALQQPIIEKYLQELKINTQAQTIISLDEIFKRVNKLIETKIETQKFLEVFVMTNEGFKNIYEIMNDQSQSTLELCKIKNDFILQIQIRQCLDDQKEGVLDAWEQKINELYQKVDSINKDMKKKCEKMEDQSKNLIDLAFFYAEPLVEKRFSGLQPAGKQVSFQEQENIFVKTLRQTKIVRDALIKINVATVKNIEQTIINGVQILHFSCHGTKNKVLVIQDSEMIGLQYNLNVSQLIQIIGRKPPNIIVFNVCFSKDIAHDIHEKFPQVTTIGYKNKANDRYCQIFAGYFYPRLFQGTKVKQAFEQTKLYMGEKGQDFVIYSNQNTSIQTYGIGLNRQKCIQIFNYYEPIEEVLFGVKQEIYEFIQTYLIDQSNTTIFLRGKPRHGKTLFIKKCLTYLKQRKKKFSKFHIINLRTLQDEVEINSIVWLRQEFEDKIQELFRQQKNIVLVFDHCDSLLKNQQTQFIYFLKQIQKLSMMCKIIVITNQKIQTVELLHLNAQKKQFTLSSTDFTEYITYKGQLRFTNKDISQSYNSKKCKKSYPPEYHQKALKIVKNQKSVESLKLYWNHLDCIYTNFQQNINQNYAVIINDTQFLLSNYLINLKKQSQQTISRQIEEFKDESIFMFPILSFINVPEQRIQQQPLMLGRKKKSQIVDDADSKIQRFLKQLEKFLNIVKKDQIKDEQVRKLYEIFHVIIGFKLLPFLSKNYVNFSKIKFIQVFRKILGICILLKRSDKHFQRFSILQMKLLILMNCLTLNQESQFYNAEKQKIYQKTIQRKLRKQFQQSLPKLVTPIKKMLEIYLLILQIRANSYLSEEKGQGMLKIYRFDQIQRYFKLYLDLKKSLEEQNYFTQCQNQFQGFYGPNQLQIILLLMVTQIKSYLFLHGDEIDGKIIEKFLQMCKPLKFLLEEISKPDQRIIKKFIEPHIYNLFNLQRLYLSKMTKPKQIRRSQIINKFAEWMAVCQRYNFSHLKASILEYKNESFSSCIALVSIPVVYQTEVEKIKYKKQCRVLSNTFKNGNLVLINPIRFENYIMNFMIQTFKKLEKTVFPRMDIFNEASLKKYNQINFPILISLFMVDCSHSEKLCQLYIENNAGASETRKIQDLEFFQSCINIFCGANTLNIFKYLQQNKQLDKISLDFETEEPFRILNHDAVFIFIDSMLQQQKISYIKQDPIQSIYKHIRNRKIFLQILHSFYEEFCKVMFKEEHENFIDQVNKAYQVGRARARIDTMIKYGHLYSQIVLKMHSQIKIYIRRKDQLAIAPPPLKIGQMNKSIYEDEETNDLVEYCFNQQIYKCLYRINKYYEDREQTNYIIVEFEKEKQESLFIENLKIKIKKRGITITQKIKELNRQRIQGPTAGSNLNSSNFRRLSPIDILKNAIKPQSFYIYRKFSKEKVQEQLKKIENESIYQSDLSQKKGFRFYIFTFNISESEGIKDKNKIELNKFSKFNLPTYYFYKKIQSFLKLKKKTEKDLLNEASNFFGKIVNDIQKKKDRRQKILQKALN